jgi:cholest-4-en-3-one 26-monooxygenase
MIEAGQSATDLSSPDTFIYGVPHAEFARLRREDPVSWTVGPDGSGFWSVTRHPDVVAVSRNTEAFSSARGGTFLEDLAEEQLAEQRLLLINMDPPGHSRYRQLVASGFSPKSVAAMEGIIRDKASALVGRAIETGECDFVTEIAARLPLETSCDLIGIPSSDHNLVLGWSNQLMASDDPEFNITPEAASAAGVEAFGYFSALAEERRRYPREDLVTTMVRATVDGERLSDLEIGLFCILLLVGGNETTRNTIAHGVLSLIDYPGQRLSVVGDRSLLPGAVEEMLRFSSALMQFRRTATTDTTIGDQVIAEGDKVVLWYTSANRDETVFSSPDGLDVGRSPNPHLAFGGGGPHICLGASLARLQLRVLFDELFTRVGAIELAARPVRLRSNFLNGIKHLQVRVTAS